jgi:hypothetical protein
MDAAAGEKADRSARPRSVGVEISLPDFYRKWIRAEADRLGVSQSEIIRRSIDCQISAAPAASERNRADARLILQSAAALRRLLAAGGAAGGFLNTIDAAADRLLSNGR